MCLSLFTSSLSAADAATNAKVLTRLTQVAITAIERARLGSMRVFLISFQIQAAGAAFLKSSVDSTGAAQRKLHDIASI